jgi:hypothetical protein
MKIVAVLTKQTNEKQHRNAQKQEAQPFRSSPSHATNYVKHVKKNPANRMLIKVAHVGTFLIAFENACLLSEKTFL